MQYVLLAFVSSSFLTASNIELSDILETPSYFISPPWCIKPPKIVLELVHLKKDRTDASTYQQLFMEIRDRYRDHIPVYTDGSRDGNDVACASFSIKHRNLHEIARLSIRIHC